MNEKRVRKNVITSKKSKTNVKNKSIAKDKTNTIKKNKKKNIKPIILVDYIFLGSLVLTIIFGMQTNGIFFIPFTLTLVTTIVCMCIILINSIYNKIKKKFKRVDK